jgi:hypothetical protein
MSVSYYSNDAAGKACFHERSVGGKYAHLPLDRAPSLINRPCYYPLTVAPVSSCFSPVRTVPMAFPQASYGSKRGGLVGSSAQ